MTNYILSSFAVATLVLSLPFASAQVPGNILPGTYPVSESTNKTTDIEIPATLKARIEGELEALKRVEAKGFHAGLTYVNGTPILMLVTDKDEKGDKGAQRRQAIATALDFLLDDASFSQARISVVEVDKADSKKQKIHNYLIDRKKYQDTVTKAAQESNAKNASSKVKNDRVLVEKVVTDLGIK